MQIHFVEKKNCTTLECFNNRTIMPDGITVLQTEPADEIVLIVSIVMLTRTGHVSGSTCLLNAVSLAVT